MQIVNICIISNQLWFFDWENLRRRKVNRILLNIQTLFNQMAMWIRKNVIPNMINIQTFVIIFGFFRRKKGENLLDMYSACRFTIFYLYEINSCEVLKWNDLSKDYCAVLPLYKLKTFPTRVILLFYVELSYMYSSFIFAPIYDALNSILPRVHLIILLFFFSIFCRRRRQNKQMNANSSIRWVGKTVNCSVFMSMFFFCWCLVYLHSHTHMAPTITMCCVVCVDVCVLLSYAVQTIPLCKYSIFGCLSHVSFSTLSCTCFLAVDYFFGLQKYSK